MGEGQLFHPGGQGGLGGHGAGGVLAGEGQLGLGVGKGALVDQQIGAPGQLHRRLTEHRVGAVHHAGAGSLRAAEAGAVDDPTVLEGDAAPLLELGVHRPRRDAQGPGPFHVEPPRPRLLVHPIGAGRDPVGEGRAAHGDVAVLQQGGAAGGGGAAAVKAKRIADTGGAGVQHPFQIVPQPVGAVEVDAGAGARQAQAGEQPGQAEHMVAVHVGHEHPPQLAHPQVTAQELVLGALAAVEQPELRPLGQAQGHGGHIAAAGGHPGAGAEKGDLQAVDASGACCHGRHNGSLFSRQHP